MRNFAVAGRACIETGDGGSTEFPFAWSSTTPFRQTVEYTVDDFHEEVGFWRVVFGFETVALDDSYALFTTGARDFWLAIRRSSEGRPAASPLGLSVMFMTQEMGSARATLASRLGGQVQQRVEPSGQEVLRFTSPFGLAIEIWQDPV